MLKKNINEVLAQKNTGNYQKKQRRKFGNDNKPQQDLGTPINKGLAVNNIIPNSAAPMQKPYKKFKK